MKLLAAGCSFVYGNELADSNINRQISQYTFPALLSKDLGLDYHCVAVPGSGSDSHVRNVITNLDHDTELVLVAWSYSERFEWDFDGIGWIPMIEMWQNEPPGANNFFKHFHVNRTNRYTFYHYVKNIVFLQNWLNNKKVKWVFCNMDHNFGPNAVDDASYKILYNSIDWNNWFTWTVDGQPTSFANWATRQSELDSRYGMGPGGHPLEYAHLISYSDIKTFCKQRGII